MRKFKELRQVIVENGLGAGGFDLSGYAHARVGPMDSPSQGQDFNQNLAQLHPAQMDRINVFLGALSAKPYLDPFQALREVQSKLSTVGLIFEIHDGPTLRSAGEHIYPLKLFGGSFGADGTTYGYKPADDNIERRLGYRLGLHVSTTPSSTGMTAMKAEIVPM